jgi:hypothetical protein
LVLPEKEIKSAEKEAIEMVEAIGKDAIATTPTKEVINEQKSDSMEGKENLNSTSEIYEKQTDWIEGKKIRLFQLLSSLDVNCDKNNSAINRFQLSTNPTKIPENFKFNNDSLYQYTYSCVKSPSISNRCYRYSTPHFDIWQLGSEKMYLKFMEVRCSEAQVLKQFKLGYIEWAPSFDTQSAWYNYTCCEAEASREIYFETPKVGGSYFFDLLSKQNIDTKDFNVITSFNGKQYFSINY